MTILRLTDYQPSKVPHKKPFHDRRVQTTRELMTDPLVIRARDAQLGTWLAQEIELELRGFDPLTGGLV